MKPIVYVPDVPGLVCTAGGKISFRQMEDYFVGISKIISQLKLQSKFIQDECGKELVDAIHALDESGRLSSDVMLELAKHTDTLKNSQDPLIKSIVAGIPFIQMAAKAWELEAEMIKRRLR